MGTLRKNILLEHRNAPIGVFDSGLGGLTVVKAIMRHLPCEDIVYFGDTARVPYGTKSHESIIRFSKENTEILLRYKVKVIVVACNSSSSHALESLKEKFSLPIIGVIEPGVKKALGMTQNCRIGIIATPATVNSQAYPRQIAKQDRRIKVISQPCPLFVPLVEEGWNDRQVTFQVAQEYLGPIKKFKADTLILGCTHYPLLKNTLTRVMGRRVALVDSAQEVALAVKCLLEKEDLIRVKKKPANYRFLVSDAPEHFKKLAKRFLGYNIGQVKRV
jgi:glutamate racemase